MTTLLDLTTAKEVFQTLSSVGSSGNKFQGFSQQYGGLGQAVLRMVAEFGAGFKKDIAQCALVDGALLSDKQKWCVAFEFISLPKDKVQEEMEAITKELELI